MSIATPCMVSRNLKVIWVIPLTSPRHEYDLSCRNGVKHPIYTHSLTHSLWVPHPKCSHTKLTPVVDNIQSYPCCVPVLTTTSMLLRRCLL